MSAKIKKIIIKYITKSATACDLDTLTEWIKLPNNRVKFKDYVETHYLITYNTNTPDTNKLIKNLYIRIEKEKSLLYKFKKQPVYKYAAAAAIIGILFSFYFFKNNVGIQPLESVSTITNSSAIVPGTDKATLTLGDGSVVALEKGNTFKTKNANSNGEEIIYVTNTVKNNSIVYNYLSVPRGGQFHVVLEDGTEVWLNSESKLKFPVAFISGATREVELVYGEAYFSVSPSTKHKEAKFKVLNKSQVIEVLGTEFNIKAYKDETNIYTTLVEGKIALGNEFLKQNLMPNQQSNLNIDNNNIKVYKVDVKTEVSWKNGIFTFENKSLKDIMKVISRWYNVDIVFENKNLESIKFKGALNKNQSIEEILSIMKSTTINNYELIDNTVILK